jgi:hypothetical protein
MYDDNLLDAVILDSLAGTDHRRRQEIIRTFIRVGYNQIMAGANANILDSLNGIDSLQSILTQVPRIKETEPKVEMEVKHGELEKYEKKTVHGGEKAISIDDHQAFGEVPNQKVNDDVLLEAAPVIDEDNEGDTFYSLQKVEPKFSEADK